MLAAAILLLLVLASYVASRRSLPQGQGSLTAREYVSRLGVGVNVDWLAFSRVEKWYFYWRSHGVSIPRLLREAGFDSVRIRVGGDVVNDTSLREKLRAVVEDSVRAGLVVVVAYTAPELREHPDSADAQRHFVQWWRTVAELLRGEPYTVAYDLIVETSGPIRDRVDVLNKVYHEAIAAIRSVDPHRVIIVTAPHVSKPFWLNKLDIDNDGYIVAEWHIYAKGPCRHGRIVYNTTYIHDAVVAALSWSSRSGIPTWVGAWRPVCPDPQRRGAILGTWRDYQGFAEAMCRELRAAGIPFALNADQWFFDVTRPGLRDDTAPLLREIIACWKTGNTG